MNKKETISYCLDTLKNAGADKAACSLNMTENKELNVEVGEMTLLRTTFDNNMGISVIKDRKKGSTSINKLDKDSIDAAGQLVMEISKGSQPDDAYDISEHQPSKSFSIRLLNNDSVSPCNSSCIYSTSSVSSLYTIVKVYIFI